MSQFAEFTCIAGFDPRAADFSWWTPWIQGTASGGDDKGKDYDDKVGDDVKERYARKSIRRCASITYKTCKT